MACRPVRYPSLAYAMSKAVGISTISGCAWSPRFPDQSIAAHVLTVDAAFPVGEDEWWKGTRL